MSKKEVDEADIDYLMNIISISMEMFKYVMAGLAGDSHPGVGTGFSPSGLK